MSSQLFYDYKNSYIFGQDNLVEEIVAYSIIYE
jgi:hypothetical protein